MNREPPNTEISRNRPNRNFQELEILGTGTGETEPGASCKGAFGFIIYS